MTNAQADRWACRLASRLIDRWCIDHRGSIEYDDASEEDRGKLQAALDALANKLGKQGKLGTETLQ